MRLNMEKLKFWFDILNYIFAALSHLFYSGKEIIECYNLYSERKIKKAKKAKKNKNGRR